MVRTTLVLSCFCLVGCADNAPRDQGGDQRLSSEPAVQPSVRYAPPHGTDDANTIAATNTLKHHVCILLEELLGFKDSPDFRLYGFGVGGKYNRWLRDVKDLYQAQPKGVHPIPILVRASPGDLMTLGMEYVSSDGEETEYTREMLPELKVLIGYENYLSSKQP
jgi:hypothetical protein